MKWLYLLFIFIVYSPTQTLASPVSSAIPWHLKKINAPEAWNITRGNSSLTIAVVDSGINYNHAALSSHFQSGKLGWNFDGENQDPMDNNGHGTFVASVAAATSDDVTQMSGVCPLCSLMALKFTNSLGMGNTEDAIRSIRYATQAHVDVIVLSFAGEGKDSSLQKALEEARDAGIVVIAAAGNDALDLDINDIYPAKFQMDGFMGVAGVDPDDELTSASNYGKEMIPIAAPGENIWGIWNNQWIKDHGTSYAAPIVAGVAGLIKSVNPKLTAKNIVDLIKSSSRIVGTLTDKINSGRVVDAYAAVKAAQSLKDPSSEQSHSAKDNPK